MPRVHDPIIQGHIADRRAAGTDAGVVDDQRGCGPEQGLRPARPACTRRRIERRRSGSPALSRRARRSCRPSVARRLRRCHCRPPRRRDGRVRWRTRRRCRCRHRSPPPMRRGWWFSTCPSSLSSGPEHRQPDLGGQGARILQRVGDEPRHVAPWPWRLRVSSAEVPGTHALGAATLAARSCRRRRGCRRRVAAHRPAAFRPHRPGSGSGEASARRRRRASTGGGWDRCPRDRAPTRRAASRSPDGGIAAYPLAGARQREGDIEQRREQHRAAGEFAATSGCSSMSTVRWPPAESPAITICFGGTRHVCTSQSQPARTSSAAVGKR